MVFCKNQKTFDKDLLMDHGGKNFYWGPVLMMKAGMMALSGM